MRIGIDVRYLSHGLVGGVHIYVKNLVLSLIDWSRDHELYLYADTKRPFELQPLPDHITVRYLPYTNPLSSVYNDLFMQRQLAQDRLDLVHFPASYGFGPAASRIIITLQDEINILPLRQIIRSHRKSLRTMTMMTYLHYLTDAAIHRADRLITVSEYSKRQILRYSRLKPDQIAVVPHACPRDIQRITDASELEDVKRRLNLKRPIVLAEAFKNPGVIIRAWKLLPKDYQEQNEIIFFSRSETVLPVVHEAVEAGIARLIVRPDRHDLSALFSMAQAFIFPSWIEGFGIPLLEAMTCGAPIIASDRGSIPEVVGDAAYIIDAEDHNALSGHLQRLFDQSPEFETLRQKGFQRVSEFTWPRITQQVISIYQECVS